MRSERARAFDLSREPAASRGAYASTGFGQSCLLARRLVEAGVPFVEVVLTGWDTHQNNFPRTRELSGQVDAALDVLIRDLRDRRLLDSTLVIWMGEFGRTPNINRAAGRDHYGRAWSTVLVGGGIRGGQVIGRTDREGAHVEDRPVSAADFMATVCRILGIDPNRIYQGPGGRTVRLVHRDAQAIRELSPS